MDKLPHAKVFLEGRYRKLTRDLPQTIFFCPVCKGHPRRRRDCERCEGFGKLTRDSVQELIGWVVGAAFKTRKNVFHGAGREDVDVRMLGEGRPFVLEVVAPKIHDVDLAAVEAEINRRNAGRLEVAGLHWTEKARVRALKETPHAKEYQARVQIDGGIESAEVQTRLASRLGQRIGVVQKTPARVAHRRADKDRERWIEIVSFDPLEGSADWMMRIRAEHGTYVKEVINGEEGSTRPSLSELLGRSCTCVELDVLAILDLEGHTEPVPPKPAVFGQNL